MRCPTLTELPPPPAGRTGWPWTEASPQLPDTMPDGTLWPRVSIVTPSYNQAQFIEETIRSVLLQGYPDLEYIIMDGGSTDGSVQIIRKYAPWLAYWVSEKDQGQSHAINKGFERATGEICAWLNSDDTYQPGAVMTAAAVLSAHPTAGMLYGDSKVVDEKGKLIHTTLENEGLAEGGFDLRRLLNERDYINQPAVFLRRSVVHQVGLLETDLCYAMDYDLWIRIGKQYPVLRTRGVFLANYRLHRSAKTTAIPYGLIHERYRISKKHGGDGAGIALHTLAMRWRAIVHRNPLDSLRHVQRELNSPEFEQLPVSIKRHARHAMSEVCIEGGFLCYQMAKSHQARAWFLYAIWLWPRTISNLGVISILLESILGRKTLECYRHYRRRLVGMFKNDRA